MNIVITGTSRGIGFELCKLALEKEHQVCAVVRTLSKAPALKELSGKYGTRLTIVEADVTSEFAPQKILDATKAWPAVDGLINNAGIYEKALDAKALALSFQVNSIAPLLLTQALLPSLRKSKKPVVVQITSKMGSIEDNTSGGSYAYRASKTALNMLNKSLAIDNPWLTALVVHPGWVQTEMGGSQAPTPPQESARGIWQVMEKSKPTESGTFLDFQGHAIPW